MRSLWDHLSASPITVSLLPHHRFLPFNTEHSTLYCKIKVRVKTKEFHKNNNCLVPHNCSLTHNLLKGKKNARSDLGLNGNWLNFFFQFPHYLFKLLVSSDLSNTESLNAEVVIIEKPKFKNHPTILPTLIYGAPKTLKYQSFPAPYWHCHSMRGCQCILDNERTITHSLETSHKNFILSWETW